MGAQRTHHPDSPPLHPHLRLSHTTLEPAKRATSVICTSTDAAMDAFFVIATPVPAEDPAQEFDETFADHERLNTTGSHSGCVIA